jgi:hypothetical protein
MSEPITPRRGMRFLHAHQITPTPTAKYPVPEPCRVTRVTETTVTTATAPGSCPGPHRSVSRPHSRS